MTRHTLAPDDVNALLRTWEALVLAKTPQLLAGTLVEGRRDPVEPGAHEAGIGGYLVDDDGRWRPLGAIRARIVRHLPADALADPLVGELLRSALLVGPSGREQNPEPGLRRRIRADRGVLLGRLAGVLPRLPGRLPGLGYDYWQKPPAPAATVHRRIAEQGQLPRRDPAFRIAAEALAIVRDPARRGVLHHGLDEHCTAMGIRHGEHHETFLRLLNVPPATTLRREPLARLASVLYRALKLATYFRAVRYVKAAHPHWDEKLDILVTMGDPTSLQAISRTPQVAELTRRELLECFRGRGMPVPLAWIRSWHAWVEHFDVDLVGALRDLDDRPAGWLDELMQYPDDPVFDRQRLGALLELAHDDVLPPRSAGDRWSAEQTAVLDAVCVLVACDGLGERYLEGLPGAQRLWTPPKRGVRRIAPGPPPTPAYTEDDERTLERLDEVVRLFADSDTATDADRATGTASRLFREPEGLHELAALLRGSYRGRDDRPGRHGERIAATVRAALARLRDPDIDPDRGRMFMQSVQMLSFDALNNTMPELVERLFGGAAGAISPANAGPLMANVLRSIAIAHSKRHRYVEALVYMEYANIWLRAVARNGKRLETERERVMFQEATQQLALQSTGLHLRILEWLIAHPRLHRLRRGDLGAEDRWRFETFAARGLLSAGEAYRVLEELRDTAGLPTTKRPDRAATVAWEINTRCMYMRALLLRATLHGYDADEPVATPREREASNRHVDELSDYVPTLWQEATQCRLSKGNLMELTRIALHYAFLKGLRFLPPEPGPPNELPEHLARPGPNGWFDHLEASRYLLDNGNNAGILLNITHAPLREVLRRRSVPRVGWEAEHGPYENWFATHRQVAKLRRGFVPAQFVRTTERLLVPVPVVQIRH